ncbi:MAG: tRNA (guanosine(37)-N1)-methyltransferase TrmD [Lachnospiraceae bacterium]|nr:tRNA (guanosine(37)-N1)-methyltransferase TrmD [Lachnospiraceae bacterium]
MNFHILTLFPEMVMQGLSTSIIGKAIERGLISIEAVNIRDYTTDKHGKVDDYTYGGGAGMLMQAQPVYDAYQAVAGKISGEGIAKNKDENVNSRARVIYVTPQGRTFNQKMAKDFAKEKDLIFLCGHYEGIDERVLEEIVTDYVSIGDYVLTGGELPAMVMIDSISRLVPGVLHNEESATTESFHNDLLEYPQYSRPEVWMGKRVPEILLSGDHAKVDKWRLEQSIERTKRLRPDLYEKWKLRQE